MDLSVVYYTNVQVAKMVTHSVPVHINTPVSSTALNVATSGSDVWWFVIESG